MPTETRARRWPASAVEGALVAFATAAVLEAVGMALGSVPDPSAWLALAVVIASFFRGPAGGIAAAAFAVAFAILEGRFAGFVFPHDARWLFRTVIVAFSLPILALLVGFLREQGSRRLARERANRAEAEEAERRYRELVEGIGAVVWQSDSDGRVQFVNHRAADLFGYPVSDWLDSDRIWRTLIHPDDYDRVLAHHADATRSGEPYEIEYRAITRTGHVLWVRTLVHVDRRGGQDSFRGVLFDVTERRYANEALREEQERLHHLLDHAADALLVYDEAGRIVEVNASACRTLGYSREEMLALHMTDIDPAFEAQHAGTVVRRLAAEGAVVQDTVYRRRDGTTFPVDVRAGRVNWGGRRSVVVLARDVSERVKLEERLRRAQSMEAIGRLAAGVAQDFNNLLTAIRGHAALLLEEVPADAPFRHDIMQVSGAAERAASLTHQLLAFSRQQIFQPAVLDTDDMVRRLEPILRRELGPGVQLEIRTGSAGHVRADPVQLEQALIDLTLYARDAMPEGGSLTITTGITEVAAADVPDTWFRPGRYSLITMTDTGHGMDAPTLAHIFEPFFAPRGRGRGIGLATAYGIIKQSGGFLVPESVPGQGSAFRLYLPLTADALTSGLPPPPASRPRTRDTGRVLVVEDEDAVRALVSRVLGKHGFEVLEARDGEAALSLVADRPLDLLVTDIVMPKMNGRELARRLRLTHPALRILLMSGYTDEESVRGRELPAGTAFLAKPFTPDTLLARVREALQARAP